MALEAAIIKPVVDGLVALYKGGKGALSKATAEKALREALLELYQIDPNEPEIEAKIAVAKAAGIINSDLVRAEQNLAKVKAHRRRSRKLFAAKKMAKKPAKKAKRKSAKKASRKMARKARV
jgi:hypothetical protein